MPVLELLVELEGELERALERVDERGLEGGLQQATGRRASEGNVPGRAAERTRAERGADELEVWRCCRQRALKDDSLESPAAGARIPW